MTRMTFVILAVVGLVVWRLSRHERPHRISSAEVKPLASSLPVTPAPLAKSPITPPAPRPRLASAAPEPDLPVEREILPGGVELVPNWETLPIAKNPALLEEWPGWKCADLSDNTERSLWVREEGFDSTGEIHHGFCNEWAKRGPGDPSIWMPPEGGEGYPIPGS